MIFKSDRISYLPFKRRNRCGGPYSFSGPSALCRGSAQGLPVTVGAAILGLFGNDDAKYGQDGVSRALRLDREQHAWIALVMDWQRAA
jgi:hypothetical protein